MRRIKATPIVVAGIRFGSGTRCRYGKAMETCGLLHRALTQSVIGGFYEVYNTLGYGFLESIYAKALEHELRGLGHRVKREVLVDVSYKGCILSGQRLDMIVDDALVVEIKATPALHDAARRQLFNYLRATRLEVGLLLHFGPRPAFYRLVSQNPS